MSAEEHKDLIRRFVETVWNGKQTDALGEFHAPEYTQNGKTFITGEAKARMREMLANVPDLHHTIEDIIAEGDKVTVIASGHSNTGGPGARHEH